METPSTTRVPKSWTMRTSPSSRNIRGPGDPFDPSFHGGDPHMTSSIN
jgi:hypothetical protein